jgi:hypothetical protein
MPKMFFRGATEADLWRRLHRASTGSANFSFGVSVAR